MSDKDPPCMGEEREKSNRLIERITAGDDMSEGEIYNWAKHVSFLRKPCRDYILSEIRAVKEIPRDAIAGLVRLIDNNFRDRREQQEREWRDRRRSG